MKDPFEMEQKREGYRVEIVRGPLAGRKGTITRARMVGGACWVWLDEAHQGKLAIRGNVRGLRYLPSPRKARAVPEIDQDTHTDNGAAQNDKA